MVFQIERRIISDFNISVSGIEILSARLILIEQTEQSAGIRRIHELAIRGLCILKGMQPSMALTKTLRERKEIAPSHLFYGISFSEKRRADSENFESNPNNSFSIDSVNARLVQIISRALGPI